MALAEKLGVRILTLESPQYPRLLKEIPDPPHVLYVSCNPKILARELPGLLEAYELRQLRAVDLFPHTRHVEVVAELALR